MRSSLELRHPSAGKLELLARVSASIRPDVAELEDWYTTYCRQHRHRLAIDLQILENHVDQGSRLLEFGAIPLLITAAMVEVGYAVSALDISPGRFAAAIENLGLDVRRCDFETQAVPFADESFDAVLFNELFEHLRINPINTMQEVERVLRPEGRLLLSTPNLRSAVGIRNLLLRNRGHAVSGDPYRQFEKLEKLGHMGHVREYTTREMIEFLSRIGFEVEEIIYRGRLGRGVTGMIERAVPSLRPFFTVVARKAKGRSKGEA